MKCEHEYINVGGAREMRGMGERGDISVEHCHTLYSEQVAVSMTFTEILISVSTKFSSRFETFQPS